jgi:hypothetical protein
MICYAVLVAVERTSGLSALTWRTLVIISTYTATYTPAYFYNLSS